ncbi:hypothetical protein EET67_10315 [Pseudaminobacter arsenicus]|uniref:Uncharacterized protein n=1 Tax=Borborobacter arsenicus TaxID=1851146 RepID=A0A432V763_9HYPH|nr:hypothetical protein EET67_10315 [Pseudaminobacter arsenicus]
MTAKKNCISQGTIPEAWHFMAVGSIFKWRNPRENAKDKSASPSFNAMREAFLFPPFQFYAVLSPCMQPISWLAVVAGNPTQEMWKW